MCTAQSTSWQRGLVWSKDKCVSVGLCIVSCSNISLIHPAVLLFA